MNNELPMGYWDFIMEWLPNYEVRDDVLRSDIYARYLEDAEVSESDIDYYALNRKSRKEIEAEHQAHDYALYREALAGAGTEPSLTT